MCMPVRAVCKHCPDLKKKRGALALEAPLASLVERPPPVPESRVRDRLGVMVLTRGGYIGAVTRMGVWFRGVSVTDICQ